MRIILFAAAAFTFSGVAGAAEPTRLDAAQLDWITASTAVAHLLQRGTRSDGANLAGADALEAAKSRIEASLDADRSATKGTSGVEARGEYRQVITGPGEGGALDTAGGGGVAVVSGNPGSKAAQVATIQPINGGSTPTITLSGGDFVISRSALPDTAVATIQPIAPLPTTVSLGSPAAASVSLMPLMPTIPTISMGSGG